MVRLLVHLVAALGELHARGKSFGKTAAKTASAAVYAAFGVTRLGFGVAQYANRCIYVRGADVARRVGVGCGGVLV